MVIMMMMMMINSNNNNCHHHRRHYYYYIFFTNMHICEMLMQTEIKCSSLEYVITQPPYPSHVYPALAVTRLPCVTRHTFTLRFLTISNNNDPIFKVTYCITNYKLNDNPVDFDSITMYS